MLLKIMFQFFMRSSELFSKPSRPTRFSNQLNIITIYTKLAEVLFNIYRGPFIGMYKFSDISKDAFKTIIIKKAIKRFTSIFF